MRSTKSAYVLRAASWGFVDERSQWDEAALEIADLSIFIKAASPLTTMPTHLNDCLGNITR